MYFDMKMPWRIFVCSLLCLASAQVYAQDEDLDALFGSDENQPQAQPTQTPPPSSAAVTEQNSTAKQGKLDVIELAEDANNDAPAPPRSRLLEEIIVTAQKREESLQDVPISVQAFSGEKLDAMGITDQTDLQKITPGLNVTNQVSYVMTFLRGIGTDATIAADPSVATYIDGIYYPFASNLAQNFGAVDRIEVLKGPQGTLFGRNATGGAIAIYTKNPDSEEFHGELLANAASFNTRLFRLHANVPLGEKYALNATALRSTSDGYYSGLHATPAEAIPGDESTGFRVKFRAQPSENFEFNLAALRMVMHLGAGSVGFTANPSTLGSLQGVEAQPSYVGQVDSRLVNDTDANTVVYGNAVYNAPWFDFKLIASDQRMDTVGVRDFDGSPQPLSTLETPSQFIDAQSLEFQILSSDQWGPDWFEWIIGGFYFKSTNGFGELNFILNGLDLAEGQAGGLTLPAPLIQLLTSVPGLPTGAINLTGLIGTDSRAVFTQATFTLTDWLDLTLGGRYQVEERFIVESTVSLENTDGESQLVDNTDNATDGDGNPYPAHDIQKNFSPKISIQLRPFENDTLIFASWQKAEKAATYNTVAIYDQPDYVAPEEIEAYEIGLKTQFFDGLVQFNAAVFDYDVKNLQTYYLSTAAGGVISFQNAGQASIRGFDFDGLIILLPSLVDNLVLSGGAAYLDTEYLDFADASGFDDDGNFAQNQDYTGNQVIRTPELTTTLSLAKTWSIWGGPLEFVFDAYYTDDFFYEASNREASRQESYWLFGSRLSYLYEPLDLRATLGVRNLTNEFYSAGFFATDYGVQPNWAAPRSYNLQLSWHF
ncbi:MAG: TonB-dependent receptor [Oceanococcus sp.]